MSTATMRRCKSTLGLHLAFIIVSMILITSCKQKPVTSNTISNADFESVFRVKQKISLKETEENLIFAPSLNVTITDKYILLPLPKVNKILVFDQNGKFLFSLGERGKGPLEFLNPIHIAYNKINDTYHVADAANFRMQLLDGNLKHQITLGFSYDLYKIFPVHNGFWFLSPHTFEEKDYLLFSYINGEISHYLSYDKKEFSFASWLGDFDGDQRIAICNAIFPEIILFNINTHETKKIQLQSDLPGKAVFSRPPESLADMQKKLQEFNKNPIQIMSIVYRAQNIFLTVGGKEKDKFFLEVYSNTGELLYTELEIPGLLLAKHNSNLFFFTMLEFVEKPAEIRIIEAEWVAK